MLTQRRTFVSLRRVAAVVALTLATVSSGVAASAAEPRWVATSNADARRVLEAQAAFTPEDAARIGLTQYDGLARDLGPGVDERYVAAMEQVRTELERRLDAEKEPHVRQDLQILIHAVRDEIRGTELSDRYELQWIDAPGMVFGGIKGLLDDQVAPARWPKALELLRRYVGQYPGSRVLTELAKARFAESRSPGRLGPFEERVRQALANAPTYARGIRDLFGKYGIGGADDALAAMDAQFADYAAWERANVLPIARTDFRLPAELYAFRLEQVGIDLDPDALIRRAQTEFLEVRAAMAALAPVVARAGSMDTAGSPDAPDYRAVIRRLKRDTIPDDRLEARYADVNAEIEAAIRRERIVGLPTRPMVMRLASPAESAAEPAPHMDPPQLIGNTGERGVFVLPVRNPSAKGDAYDDFDYPAATWTLSAHEGRPGHELQYSAMIEQGVSQARSLYAFNSVNVEGWALYAEAEMLPYEPLEGQLIALQFRLLRAARAFLDPMLNLGRLDVAAARRVLADDVVLSPAMVRQEIDRYTFRAPGQAGSYFYGYTRLLELRAEIELELGKAFDRKTFNDCVLAQGLLPPDLLAAAVRAELLPARRR